jgi:hypothetical protein
VVGRPQLGEVMRGIQRRTARVESLRNPKYCPAGTTEPATVGAALH